MQLKIAISSGKGGTGKTFLATNIANTLKNSEQPVRYLDCDVEEPNGHLFLKPEITNEEKITVLSPARVDQQKCTNCGKCAEVCNYNAITIVNNKTLFFKNLCHICGACTTVCPENAIIEEDRLIGVVKHGRSNNIDFHYGLLETAEGGMSPRLIRRVKKNIGEGINILDSAPGTACSVVETVKDADICVLVTDPTPFGINDLKLSVNMCRSLNQEPVVLVNRAEYFNNDLKKYCQEAHLEIIGEIPDDKEIATTYAVGNLITNHHAGYIEKFFRISRKIIELSAKKRPVNKAKTASAASAPPLNIENGAVNTDHSTKLKELVVLSGKGGTGKTSLVASFAALAQNTALADCDVDAADLHLILQPEIKTKGQFSGGYSAVINADKCTGCGLCYEACRFEAINISADRKTFTIDEMACEGCGVCGLVCPREAVILDKAVNGTWYVSDTRFGPLAHAKLGMAEENTGRLVTLVRNKKDEIGSKAGLREAVIDGSPGTGCPVIASVTGSNYVCIVTEPTVSGIHDLKRILDVINFFNLKAGIVVNKYDLDPDQANKVIQISADYQADFLGQIPYDKNITRAQIKGVSVVEYTSNTTVKQIKKIWHKLKNKLK